MLHCVAVCCSMLQCVAVCCSTWHLPIKSSGLIESASHTSNSSTSVSSALCCSVLQCVAMCCIELQCVALSCNVLQCVAVSCSELQCVAVHRIGIPQLIFQHICLQCPVLQCVAVRCSVLRCVAVCCSASNRPPTLHIPAHLSAMPNILMSHFTYRAMNESCHMHLT